jgi:Protein of unknown function (DUF3575)
MKSMNRKITLPSILTAALLINGTIVFAQQNPDTNSKGKNFKNVIRYNISGALVFGLDKYIIIGYERVLSPKRSISLNVGAAAFPKLVRVETDSFSVDQDAENKGYNISVDYRFYLSKENKYAAPHGVYIGPYYSYNQFERTNDWTYKGPVNVNKAASTNTKISIHTIGAELGYQFVFWKRLTLDLVMIGPGIGIYDVKAKMEGNLDPEDREQLKQALTDLLTQKFPGMNFVFADKGLDADGVMKTTSIGYRYLIHIGFRF